MLLTDFSVPNKTAIHKFCTKGAPCSSAPMSHYIPAFRLSFYCVAYSKTCVTEIKPHISKCKAGWTGNFCHQQCPNKLLAGEYYSGNKHTHSCQVSRCTNAKRGEYFTGSGTDGRTSCPTAPCTNKLNVGEYYSESGSNVVCAVAQCTNAKNGEYYTGRGLSGRTSCPTAPCTNKPKAGLRFITNGGTSSTGCKIGGVLIYLLLTHTFFARNNCTHTVM